jgi:predicted  nucleic acid-binding Zn-ribbon protein
MSKINPWVVAVALISAMSLGMWGCNNQKSGAFSAKVREMEGRYTKLEDDFRLVSSAHDKGRKKLVQLEKDLAQTVVRNEELSRHVEELRQVVQERDDLRKQLQTRTGERDNLQGQLMQFSRDLQSLAGRAEAAASNLPSPSLNVVIPASRKVE